MRDEARYARLQREIHRLRTSPSLRLGVHLTNAIKKPWKAPFLLITLPFIMISIGFELLGWKSQPRGLWNNSYGKSSAKNESIVIFPTNGVGFGHFTRMLAVAKRMRNIDSSIEIIFFTTMPTLHLLKEYDIPAHHVAGPKNFKNLNSEEWNDLLEEELTLCLEIHKPTIFLFDGAFPYRGMLRAIDGMNTLKKYWMRRGTLKKKSSIPVDSIEYFDAVIHPGDGVNNHNEESRHDVDIVTCPPIILLDNEDLFTREESRKRLGLPLDAIIVYIQLGAGEINDIESEIRMTIEALTKNPEVYVVLGESLIGERVQVDLPKVGILRDYPNSIYFNGFDATVQAGGYNSFHETRTFGLPALFYPNMNTGMDDQLARCKVAEQEGWGIVLESRTAATIEKSCLQLLDLIGIENTQSLENGAEMIASKLVREIYT